MNEQGCYALEDLAQRWGCSVHDLVWRGATGDLQICADVAEVGRGSGRARRPATPEGQDPQPPGWDKLPRIRREREEGLAEFASNRERTTRATPPAVYVLPRCLLRRMAAPDFVALELEDALEFDGERWLKVEFWPPFEIGRLRLRVLAEEVARYERGLPGKPQASGAVPAGAAQAQPEREARPAETKPPADWVREARELARGFIAQADGSYFPPQEALANQVADVLRKRGIHGPSGTPLSAGTIKRHALKGITSGGANKLRHIAGQRGK